MFALQLKPHLADFFDLYLIKSVLSKHRLIRCVTREEIRVETRSAHFALMSRLGDADCSAGISKRTRIRRRWWERRRRNKRKRRKRRTDDDASRRAQTASSLFLLKSVFVWDNNVFAYELPGHVPPPARREAWAALRASPGRRLVCPSSVASDTAPQMLYLASRRSQASAAPQPPVDSQLTPTVSSKSKNRASFSIVLIKLFGTPKCQRKKSKTASIQILREKNVKNLEKS